MQRQACIARTPRMHLCTWGWLSQHRGRTGIKQQTRQARTLRVGDDGGASVGHGEVARRSPVVGVVVVEQDLAGAVLELGVAVLRSMMHCGIGAPHPWRCTRLSG